jgi:plastocyanin
LLLKHVPAVVVLGLLAAGCGSGSGSAAKKRATVSPSPGHTVTVAMKALAFAPSRVSARVGQRVVWTNYDHVFHNVIYVSGPRFKSSRPRMRAGTNFKLKLTQTGTIRYFCSIHPWMKGTIVVSS